MLEIPNVDEGKEEWSMSGAHIVIPVIDRNEKMNSNTITLNTLNNGDQTVLTNGHNLVIGLDRNLFETHNNKADLLVIQNPDLKLLRCNSDLKNAVTYTLSYVDQEKSEMLWESPVMKDKSKPEWCSHDKAVFEIKDVLNYDAQDPSKNWQDDLGKNNEQMNLDDVNGDLSQIAKVDSEILLQVEESPIETKKLEVDKDDQYIINYYPNVQNCRSISLFSNSVEYAKRKSKAVKNFDKSFEIKNKLCTTSKVEKNINPSTLENTQNVLDVAYAKKLDKLVKEVIPSIDISQDHDKSELKNNSVESPKIKFSNLSKNEETDLKIGSCLPEKSLPLKKKAKMKKTMVLTGPDISKLKQGFTDVNELQNSKSFNEKLREESENNLQKVFSGKSDSDEPLINKSEKRKKPNRIKVKLKQDKVKKTTSTYLVNQSCHKVEPIDQNFKVQQSEVVISKFKIVKNNLNFEEKNFNTIFELLEDLKKFRMINASVWQILHSGLKEMNVDILKEMNAKSNETSQSPENFRYSTQLKAFALVLYFKQPAAFNYLAKLYKNGWPSLNVIKEWKRQINNHPRPNFSGISKESENGGVEVNKDKK